MTDLFEAAAARDAKLASMAQADANANKSWADVMLELVRLTCCEQLYFTSDDIFDRYDCLSNPPKTHEGRAFGPVMTRAAKAGYCEKANVAPRESTRKGLHASPRTIWRSKLYAQ